ncbi:MAG: hypothetical protein U9N56_09850, partial [Actinomycetota bacterium]|nr:hypothetical protein [Actinomycetota bacterium]
DGETWLLEFPDTQVDGDVAFVVLGEQDSLTVISRDSLVVDRLIQASDNTKITFDDAVRLGMALGDTIDWARVEAEIDVRHSLEPGLGLPQVLRRVRQAIDSNL